MSKQNIVPEILPLPHKAILKKHGVKMAQAARYLDISFGYMCSILNDSVHPSQKIRTKLDELMTKLEAEHE